MLCAQIVWRRRFSRRFKGEGGFVYRRTAYVYMCAQPFVPGNDWTHLAVQRNSLLLAIDRGVQFLTRSHRTALSEQTGPVPRVIAISFSSKTPYTVLVSGSAAPEVTAMMAVFLINEAFCQTPMVAPTGIEPVVFALKGQ